MSVKTSKSGVVMSVDGPVAKVLIDRHSACSSCRLSGSCGGQECKSLVVEVRVGTRTGLRRGDTVRVVNRSPGWLAVVIGYGLPLAVLMLSCGLAAIFGLSDACVAFMGLAAVAAYFLLMSCFRKRLERALGLEIV